jgi:hypothetical protein
MKSLILLMNMSCKSFIIKNSFLGIIKYSNQESNHFHTLSMKNHRGISYNSIENIKRMKFLYFYKNHFQYHNISMIHLSEFDTYSSKSSILSHHLSTRRNLKDILIKISREIYLLSH